MSREMYYNLSDNSINFPLRWEYITKLRTKATPEMSIPTHFILVTSLLSSLSTSS